LGTYFVIGMICSTSYRSYYF